jgi:pimeloyl-ACP methyl ester carboxylesterase
VRLERRIELDAPSLLVHEWPGRGGVIVHIADPLAPSSNVAPSLDPTRRILSVHPRGDAPHQVHVADVLELIAQFGFEHIELVGEGRGCAIALLVAAWRPTCVARVRLIAARFDAEGDTLFARSLRDCAADWAALRDAID